MHTDIHQVTDRHSITQKDTCTDTYNQQRDKSTACVAIIISIMRYSTASSKEGGRGAQPTSGTLNLSITSNCWTVRCIRLVIVKFRPELTQHYY